MTLQIELFQLVGLLLTFLGFCAGAGKLLLAQIDKRLDARFEAQERAAEAANASLRDTLARFTQEDRRVSDDVFRLAERVNQLEATIKNSPNHEDMRRISDKLGRQGETMSRLEGELKGLNDTLRLILARFTEKGLP